MNFIKTKIIAGALLILLFFVVYKESIAKKHNRYVFFFKNCITKEVETEIRFVKKQSIKPEEVAFVEELMLGPINHENYLFFDPKERLNRCFVKNKILHIDFSENFLKVINPNFDSETIAFLLRKNIFTNCKNINSVFISINGAKIYEFKKNNVNS